MLNTKIILRTYQGVLLGQIGHQYLDFGIFSEKKKCFKWSNSPIKMFNKRFWCYFDKTAETSMPSKNIRFCYFFVC